MLNKYKFLFLLSVVFFGVLISTVHSQTDPKITRRLVMQDEVFPYKAMEYETAQKALNEFFKKYKFNISFSCFQTDDFTYQYVFPFGPYNDVDVFFKMFNEKIAASDKKEYDRLYAAFAGTINANNSIVIELKDSYKPKNPYLKPGEAGFIHWDYFELLPGKEPEALELLKEYKKMNEKFEIPVANNQWSVSFGDHSSTVIFSTLAKDDVDYYTHNKEAEEKYMNDPDFMGFYMKFLSYVRSFKHFNGKPRLDLSYSAAE